jgi:GNAT superfamily N-acetyltransferase
MHHDTIEIKPFDQQAAEDEQIAQLNKFENRLRAEREPDMPPAPIEEAIQWWRNKPEYLRIHPWLAWSREGEVIGKAFGVFWQTDTNKHLMFLDLEILPEHRRKGLARRLLPYLVDAARQENRRLFTTGTNDRIPAGEAFMQRLGASRGLEAHINQLVLADLDAALLQRWQARIAERGGGFRLGLWEGPYPEEQLAAIANLFEVMNTSPRDNLDMEDFHITPEQIRAWEKTQAATGTERWTMYVQEEATGTLAGFTEVFWNPNRPQHLWQGDTGVFPQYRNRGLGRWLKAAMLEKILRERPQVKHVRTGNADSNAPMLSINHELGFKPYMAETAWQVEVEQVANYLNS